MALQLLKNLVKKNIETPNEEKNSHEKNNDVLFGKKDTQSYEDWGFEMSQKQKGSKNAYAGCWSLVRDYFRKKEGEDEGKRQADINKAKGELEKKEVEIEQKKSLFSNIEKKIEELKSKIEELNKDIFKIKENPEEILKDSTSKVSFIIGLTILVGLTVYLFMFYSSASYSAFFKDFTPDDTKVATAIFDAHALSKSLEEGVLQLILILTIPFAFLGLGYLIHKFQEQEGKSKYFKIGGFLLVTFIFDFILAYGITKQIYDIERMNDITGRMPEYSISLAFTNVHFWIIIFAGFVVYLIWGFIFDFTMEAYDKLDIVKRAIQSKENEIKLLEQNIKTNQDELKMKQDEIHTLELVCVDLRKIINGDTVFIDWQKFYQCVREFTNGWTQWMTANKVSEELINEIHHTNEEFMAKHQEKVNNK